MKRTALQTLTLTALFAALAAALTFVHIPFPMTSGGYVHPGDGVVYLAACLLPLPWGAVAAAIGCGVADLAAPLWLPATLLIKPCMALFFSAKRERILCKRNALALLPAALINAGGYFLYEGLALGQWAALAGVLGNVLQSMIAAAIFVLLGAAMDRLRIKRRFL